MRRPGDPACQAHCTRLGLPSLLAPPLSRELALMIVLNPLLQVLDIAIGLYIWAVIISAILSWLVHFGVVNPRNQFVRMIGEFLWRISEPALRPIRRFLPNLGGIDISPVILILGLIFLQRVLLELRLNLMMG